MSFLKRQSYAAYWLAVALVLPILAGQTNANDFVLSLLEKVRQKYSDEAYAHIQRLRELTDQLEQAGELSKISQINDFVNQSVLFVDDVDLWGVDDYWATPLETLGRGAGDCEDFSIVKYMLLKKVGVSQDKLRLTYVKARMPSGNLRAHMVVAYYPTPASDPLILDNLSFDLSPASRRSDLFPVFSFNDKGVFVANQPSVRAGSPANISKWRDLLQRMRQEGLE